MKILKFALPLFVAALSLTGCYSLAEDITPPPGYDYSTPVPSTVPTEVMYFPFMPPNPDAGAAIFAEKCEPCHGPSGFGDGPKAAELPNPVSPIGDPELSRSRTPEDWYRQVTNGNIDKYMPPFTSLTERQRWDVVAYAFNLSVDPEDIPAGQTLYSSNCSSCHGPEGAGDGADAAGLPVEPPAFTDQSLMAERSLDDLTLGMTHPDVPDLQDAGNTLNDAERMAIATYLRSLTFEGSDVVAAQPGLPGTSAEATPEATLPEPGSTIVDEGVAGSTDTAGIGQVVGQVINVSGGLLPDEMEVTLYGFDNFQQVLTETAMIEQDGFFNFAEVPMPEGRAFIVAVDYQEATYSSDIAVVDAESKELALPISIYETSTDTSALSVDRLHVFFEFVSADTVRVAELILITNPTASVIVAKDEGQPTLEIDLPPGAENLQFDGGTLGTQFVELDGGFGDLRTIQPGVGSHQILFSFDLPYSRNFTLDQSIDFPVSALVVMLPDVGVQLNSDTLVSSGTRQMEGQENSFELFTGGGLAAGTKFPIQLSGSPSFGSQPAITLGDNRTLTAGMLALGVVFVVVGVWLYRRQQSINANDFDYEDEEPIPEHILEMSSDELMDAIIALDERYKAGDLPESAYLKQRSLLKNRLEEILD